MGAGKDISVAGTAFPKSPACSGVGPGHSKLGFCLLLLLVFWLPSSPPAPGAPQATCCQQDGGKGLGSSWVPPPSFLPGKAWVQGGWDGDSLTRATGGVPLPPPSPAGHLGTLRPSDLHRAWRSSAHPPSTQRVPGSHCPQLGDLKAHCLVTARRKGIQN